MLYKRPFDILLAVTGLIICLPFFIILSLWIALDSPGGVFYKQERIGKARKPFKLFKFRSMYTGADKKGLITVGNRDHRITSSGYFIRKYKVDELPQLINVLLGDMSFVGPRPEVKQYVDMYSEEQLKVLSVRPGITDYASILYANENEILAQATNPNQLYIDEIMPAKLKLNQQYINEMGFWTDIKIILQTIFKIGLINQSGTIQK